MKELKKTEEEKLPQWAQKMFYNQANLIGINVHDLDEEQFKKLMTLLDEIGYDPMKL